MMRRAALALLFGLMPLPALAATDFFFTGPTSVRPGSEATITLQARFTDPINAIAGTVRFDPRQLTVVAVDDADSSIRFWTERPVATASGSMHFAGIIPGGIAPAFSDTIVIGRFQVRGNKVGTGQVVLEDALVYLNQPTPTADRVSSQPLTVRIAENAPDVSVPPVAGADSAYVQVVRDPGLNDGAWTALFDVRIGGSTADAVSVRERFLGIGGSWQTITGPYRLSDQHRLSILEVRSDASDAPVVYRSIPAPLIATWTIIALAIGLGAWWRLRRRTFH